MELSKVERLSLYSTIRTHLKNYHAEDIENGVMLYCLHQYGFSAKSYDNELSRVVANILAQFDLPTDLETIAEFFESLLEEDYKGVNGIVFTPKYIAEYIISSSVLPDSINSISSSSIIDPGCGCGIFLVAAAEYVLKASNKPIDSIIEENIFGVDIVPENVKRCSLILKLLSAQYGGNYETIKPNIVCKDSLKTNWRELFGVEGFDYIIGNPPYVNPHDMNKDTVLFLKENYSTTQNGVFNIFYAFIEKGMEELHPDGILSFIVPNNFLTMKSSLELREYLQMNMYVKSILDFGDNMVFKPVRTYNCIIQLSKSRNELFKYYVFPKVECIEKTISKITFNIMESCRLDKNGWKLVDEKTYRNLRRIESQPVQIKKFIRTGIATLRDGVYLVDKDVTGYYKLIRNNKFYIEDGLVKPIYKISDLKIYDNIEDAKRYIIFPYVKTKSGYVLIDEETFKSRFPNTYECLLNQRDELDSRDKGKGAVQGWYAYGRSQGLNKYGKKLLFPTFASKPKFMFVEDEDALFCNGYAVFENDTYDLDIILKVLNSFLMEYYISNTSYSIEGGYYCYQKKYVERFSLPWFSDDDIAYIRKSSKAELDSYLWSLYGLD